MVVPLLWSYPAMTEEGAVASAPLPPPLPTARSEPSLPPAVAVLPDRPTDEKGGSLKPEFDQPKTPSPQSRSSVSTPSPRTRTAHKKDARRSRGRASAESVDLVGRPAPDAGGQRRNPPPALHQPGRLSPPPDLYPVPPAGNGAQAWAEPPPPPLLAVPRSPWGPPVGSYNSNYPYRWPPAGPAPFRPGY